MKCAQCHTQNAPLRKYCSQCGSSLSAACGRCSFANALTDQFCGGCGVAVSGNDALAGQARSLPAMPQAPMKLGAAPGGLDLSELDELLRKPSVSTESALPAKISQSVLDNLFSVSA